MTLHTYRIIVEGTYREIFHVTAESEDGARTEYVNHPEKYEANSFMEVLDSEIVSIEPPRSETV